MGDLSEEEKKISAFAVWIWRNLLASGVFIACFGFLYMKCEKIEDKLIEVSTVLKERIRLERGDYGWFAPAAPEEPEPTLEDIEEGDKIRQHISNFADKK